jgi:hypothetical protein
VQRLEQRYNDAVGYPIDVRGGQQASRVVAKVGALGTGTHAQAFSRAQAGARELGIVSMRGLEVSDKLELEPHQIDH